MGNHLHDGSGDGQNRRWDQAIMRRGDGEAVEGRRRVALERERRPQKAEAERRDISREAG